MFLFSMLKSVYQPPIPSVDQVPFCFKESDDDKIETKDFHVVKRMMDVYVPQI